MKSVVASSYELDDTAEAARELAASVRERLAFRKNSVGMLFCDADTDGAALTRELKDSLGIEVAGMTTLACLNEGGHQTAAIVLTVFTADDCLFRATVSDSLLQGDPERKIAQACAGSSPLAGSAAPGLLLAFCPSGMPFSGDIYPDILARALPATPILGGAASDDYDYQRARVFLSGREYKDAAAFIGIWGNVRPAFALRHVTSRFAERIRRVTRAEGNIVHSVGDETFISYLEGFGLKTDVSDPLLAFTSYPMMLTREKSEEVPLMRHIAGLNHADGSGSFFGDVPEGTLANICLINKNDILTACRESMSSLLEEAKERPDYAYSTVLCISCCGRAVILGSDAGAEGRVLKEMLPPELSLSGAYCLGEICPTFWKGGKISNRFHNCSIAFCML
ncbi:MAG: FIST C-terminal domain-containing protein [Deltaproteobacteria bacterium]|jgi:hypothetical protein|nr:FIST C-terminal domain-containing protein [Deltaproteobacteria bacterium]